MNPTILVVSPNLAQSQQALAALKAAGYRVLWAGLGQSALDLIHSERPDLALVDWTLPDRSSLSVVREIRAGSRLPRLPIILRGVEMREEDIVRGLDAGADLCLAEPFLGNVLAARVRALLRRRSGCWVDDYNANFRGEG